MTDSFENYRSGLSSPAAALFSITPSDVATLTNATRGLYVGGGGDIAVETVNGDMATLVSVPTGTILPIRAARIAQTGTTATNLVGLA